MCKTFQMDNQSPRNLEKPCNEETTNKDKNIEKSDDSTSKSTKAKKDDDNKLLFDINTIKNIKLEKGLKVKFNTIKLTCKFDLTCT